MSEEHHLKVYDGHSVDLEAHQEVWSMLWEEVEALGGMRAVGRLPCPGCGVLVDETEGSITLAVHVPGQSAN